MHHRRLDYLPVFASPLHSLEDPHRDASDESAKEGRHDDAPPYVRHKETTNSELFYDLFFIANLTVFGIVKEVNDGRTLTQYIGFFSVIWLTWYQVSMYDVRFAVDSLFERIARLCQFGVMVGFAVSGPTFNPGETLEDIVFAESEPGQIPDPNLSTFKTITLIMMASRLTLAIQYLQSMWHLRGYAQTRLPMILNVTTYFAAAIIYGCLFFTFNHYHTHPFVVWYIGSALESIICTAISSRWRVISFKGTHLVQRMSLLTLIILGEGVMGLTEKCQAIVKGRIFSFDPSTIGDIVCGVLIIYFIYIIYFDWIQEEHMGTIRQQIWSFLHFPLHLALVLTLEGSNQFIAWRAATVLNDNLVNDALTMASMLGNNSTSANFLNASMQLQLMSDEYIEQAMLSAGSFGTITSVVNANSTIYAALSALNDTLPGDLDDAIGVLITVCTTLSNVVYSTIGFEPSAYHKASSTTDPTSTSLSDIDEVNIESQKILEVAEKTLIYFFVCLGAVIILQGIIAWLSKPKKANLDRIRLGCTFFVGTLVCLISLIDTSLRGRRDIYYTYIQSPWILPTAVLLLFIVVVVDNIRLRNCTLLQSRLKRK